jgi:hypothetical protein
VVQYMNIVWARMTKEGKYNAWLSRKRPKGASEFIPK